MFTLVGSKSDIVNRPIMEDDPRRRKPDISRAKELFGWEPVVSSCDSQSLIANFHSPWKL